MVNRLEGNKVVGIKQTVKAIKNGKVRTVYIAMDADDKLIQQIKTLTEHNSLQLVEVNSMKELGRMCGIDVGAATSAILKG